MKQKFFRTNFEVHDYFRCEEEKDQFMKRIHEFNDNFWKDWKTLMIVCVSSRIYFLQKIKLFKTNKHLVKVSF